MDDHAHSSGSLSSSPPPPSLPQHQPSLQRLPSLSAALKPFSSAPVRRKPLPSQSTPTLQPPPSSTSSPSQTSSSTEAPFAAPFGGVDGSSPEHPSPPDVPPKHHDDSPLARTYTNGSLSGTSIPRIQHSPAGQPQTQTTNGIPLGQVIVEEEMASKSGSRPPPLRTDSSSSNRSLTVMDGKKPTTPGSKFTSFFSRKPIASPSSESAVTDISDRRSPLPSPYAGSPHASTHFSGGSVYGNGGGRQPQSQSSQDSIDFDGSSRPRGSYHSDSAQRCLQLEAELREISTELANSIKREMDLEDLAERLQTEGPGFHREADRTSDYFSDSGTSSIRPQMSDDPKEEVARVKRESEQLRAQLKVEMSQKWQTERSSRQALEAHVQILEQRLSQDRRNQNDSIDNSSRAKELETSLEDARRRLLEERQTKENFEDLLTALRVDLEQHRNERDNLRDEVVPQLRLQIEGLEQNLGDFQKSPYELSRLQQELQSLRDENAALHSARAMNMQFQSISEEDDMGRSQSRAGALQRSSTIHIGKGNTRGAGNRASLSRSNSIVNRAIPDSQQPTADQLKDITQQRDALHVTVRYLLRRQENQRKQYEKKIRIAEAELERAKSSRHEGKGGYEREVRTLRSEINLLRKRTDDALEQKWQCEKGLAGLKMDLDRSKQETSSLEKLLQTRDESAPEVLSSTLEKALKDLQLQREQARQHESLGSLHKEEEFASELERSAQRSEELAAQVRRQMTANAELRGRLKQAISSGEANQAASAGQINELQAKLRKLEDVINVAQMQSETAVMKHEEEVRVLRASHNVQLMRSASGRKTSGMLTPNLPRTPLSPMFASSKRSPRLDQTTSGPGLNLQQALKTEYLERKVVDLEKALADAEKEMKEVVGRMNTAQIGVAELESERDEALRQTRRLEAEIIAEREKVQNLIDYDYSYDSDY
ncbi:hypothetical protein B0A52_01374 [Exophiala mesophila]|uniref:DUF7603 domain-containing protein n=1 Tax=Exophiala mesophila TaxID=212818 RepID=A0A438NHA1_EXOME|nr:hypothetical protein B0A52_01374 [Exophiala mesophila]